MFDENYGNVFKKDAKIKHTYSKENKYFKMPYTDGAELKDVDYEIGKIIRLLKQRVHFGD